MSFSNNADTPSITRRPAWKPPGRTSWSTSSVYSQLSFPSNGTEGVKSECKCNPKKHIYTLSSEERNYCILKKQFQSQTNIIRSLLPSVPELITGVSSLQRCFEQSEEASHDQVIDREDVIVTYDNRLDALEVQLRRKKAALSAHYSQVSAERSDRIRRAKTKICVLDRDISDVLDTINSNRRFKETGQDALLRHVESIQAQITALRAEFSTQVRSLNEEFQKVKEELNDEAQSAICKSLLSTARARLPELWLGHKATNAQLKHNIVDIQLDINSTEREIKQLKMQISILRKENNNNTSRLKGFLDKKRVDFAKRCLPGDAVLLDIVKRGSPSEANQ